MLAHPLAGGARDLVLAQTYTGLLRILTAAIAARSLGPARYGSVALLIAFPTLVWTFVGVKSAAITTRYMTGYWSERKLGPLGSMTKLGYIIDGASALIALVITAITVAVLSPNLGVASGHSWLSVAFAAALPFYSASGTTTALLSSLGSFRAVAGLQAAESTLVLLFVGLSLITQATVAGVIVATAFAFACTGSISLVVAAYVSRKRAIPFLRGGSPAEHAISLQELRGSLAWNYLAVTLNGMLVHLPLLILGRIAGPRQAGYLRAASSVVAAGSYAESAMGRVAYPTLASRWKSGDREELAVSLRSWTKKAGLPVGIVLLASSLAFPVLIPLVFGEEYRPMVLGAQLLMVGIAVSTVFFYLIQFFYATGYVATWTKFLAAEAILVVVLCVPAAKIHGFLGVAVVIAAGTAILNLVMRTRLRPLLTQAVPNRQSRGSDAT